MNSRYTWILIAVALVLFGFIMLVERREGGVQPGPGAPAPLFARFDPAAATGVEVVLRTNRIIRADRSHDQWTLTMPLKYPAYAARIEGLLNIIGRLNRESHISAQELLSQNQSLAAYGLDPPLASIIIEQSGERTEIKVGGRSPVGGRVYVQWVGSDGIYFTDAQLHERLPNNVDDWRDPGFLRLKDMTFNRMELVSKKVSYELQIDPSTQLWRLTKPMNARADNQKIQQMIRMLKDWNVVKFIPDNASMEMESVGLQPPEVALMLGQGTNDLLVAHFGKVATNGVPAVYARCLPQTNVVLVSRQTLDWLYVPFSEFREPRVISQPVDNVDLIEVMAAENFSLQRDRDGVWFLGGTHPAKVDPELMTRFLADLSNLRVTEYVKDVVTDFTAYGLDKPLRQYTLRRMLTNSVNNMTNPILAQLNFGSNVADRVYARLSDESSVYATSWAESWRLPSYAYQMYDRQLWSFATNQVSAVTIQYNGVQYKMARNNLGQWTMPPSPAALTAPLTNIVEEVLYRMGRLRAESWTASGNEQLPKFGIAPGRHSLTVDLNAAAGGQSFTMDFGAQAPSQDMYASVVRNGQRLVFEFRLSLFQLYVEILKSLTAPPPGNQQPHP